MGLRCGASAISTIGFGDNSVGLFRTVGPFLLWVEFANCLLISKGYLDPITIRLAVLVIMLRRRVFCELFPGICVGEAGASEWPIFLISMLFFSIVFVASVGRSGLTLFLSRSVSTLTEASTLYFAVNSLDWRYWFLRDSRPIFCLWKTWRRLGSP